MGVWGITPQPKQYFLALCISNTLILDIQKHFCGQIWCRGMRAWGATSNPHIFWLCAFQTHPSWVSKNALAGRCGAEVCALEAPRQDPTLFGIAHFKHRYPRYPKTLLRAELAQRYARLERHAKKPHFLALRISNTPIVGIQKHFGGHIWCRGMRAWSATPNLLVFWHCTFQTPSY